MGVKVKVRQHSTLVWKDNRAITAVHFDHQAEQFTSETWKAHVQRIRTLQEKGETPCQNPVAVS